MIEAFFNEPVIAQFLVGAVLLFFFFAFVIELQLFINRIINVYPSLEKIRFITLPVLLFFLVCNILFNIFYMPLLFGGEMANKHGEGWLVTDRVSYHIGVAEFEMINDIKPGWRFKVASFICRHFLNPVDPGHCSRATR